MNSRRVALGLILAGVVFGVMNWYWLDGLERSINAVHNFSQRATGHAMRDKLSQWIGLGLWAACGIVIILLVAWTTRSVG